MVIISYSLSFYIQLNYNHLNNTYVASDVKINHDTMVMMQSSN